MSALRPILVVDDEESIRRLVEVVLSEEGYEVLGAAHGVEALACLEVCEPALILLDMQMPVMDGWQFQRAHRERAALRGLDPAPVVVLTAATNADQRAAEVGAVGFLSKPFDLDVLIATVEQYASPSPLAEAAAS